MEQQVLVNMVLKISCGKTAATFTCELVALHPLLAPEDTSSTLLVISNQYSHLGEQVLYNCASLRLPHV